MALQGLGWLILASKRDFVGVFALWRHLQAQYSA
jgi:hypothetical protein